MTKTNADAAAALEAAWERELQAIAAERMRRRAALVARRREHATRRANGLIDRQAARLAKLRSTSDRRGPAAAKSGPQPDP
jgi:hypothetical protein